MRPYAEIEKLRKAAKLKPLPYADQVLKLINKHGQMQTTQIWKRLPKWADLPPVPRMQFEREGCRGTLSMYEEDCPFYWPDKQASLMRLEGMEIRGQLRRYSVLKGVSEVRTETRYRQVALGPDGREINSWPPMRRAYCEETGQPFDPESNETPQGYWPWFHSEASAVTRARVLTSIPFEVETGGKRTTAQIWDRGLTPSEWDARLGWWPVLLEAVKRNDPLPGAEYSDWLDDNEYAREADAARTWRDKGQALRLPNPDHYGPYRPYSSGKSRERYKLFRALRPDVFREPPESTVQVTHRESRIRRVEVGSAANG